MNGFLGAGARSTAGMAAEEKIPQIVVHDVLPRLDELLLVLIGLQKKWNNPQDAVPDKITAAAAAGQPLGGYSPADWARWGQSLIALNAFLATEITIQLPDGTTETRTPEGILTASYKPVQA